jgi:2-keto-4-pentenoate hydratase/2-oxohepta-3-ene-1,7-dioic acid hydratase in catechol pathway
MVSASPQIAFGIGCISGPHGGEAAVVVVDDRVALLTDVTSHHRPPHGGVASMRELIAEWDRWHDWLRSLDLQLPDAHWRPLDEVRFLPPVPEPWNIFQTYHNYERPSRTTGRSDPPKSERLLPDVFFGSRSALAGYGDPVRREHGVQQFDFEVEVTAVIGRLACRVPAARAGEYIAGYAVANDFTTHRAWWRERRRQSPINDNIRMKNFPGYTPMSRAIIPRDLVGDPCDLAVKTWVDGRLRQDTRTGGMLWPVHELIEYLSHIMPLRPGDLILTGSPEELPLAPGEAPGVQPGQTVLCEVERIGRLENRVEEQPERQPNEP